MKKKTKVKNVKKVSSKDKSTWSSADKSSKKSSGSSWSSYDKDVKKVTNKEIETKDMSRSNVVEDKYLIWHVQGGLGKNVAATALLPALKSKYNDRKLIIVASWPEVWSNHPIVDKLYQIGNTPHFYDDYIRDKDTILYRHEAYNQTAHVQKSQHLIHNWCDLMDLEYNEKEMTPGVILNYAQQQLSSIWVREKPTMVLQTNGGPFVGQKYPYNWCRDIPFELSQQIVNRFVNEFHIYHVCRKESPILNGVERIDGQMSNIELFSILANSSIRVLNDSCLQHAARAFQLPSTVLWIGTSPKVFGYDFHNNIIAKNPILANQTMGSYMFDYQFDNNVHECPYTNYEQIFNPDVIIRNIENFGGGQRNTS